MRIRTMPDGALLDRVGEFVFISKEHLRLLFDNDPGGYAHAMFGFVQTLASTRILVGTETPALTMETSRLKEHLVNLGCMELTNPFVNNDLKGIKTDAVGFLDSHWDSFMSQLDDINSSAFVSIQGHVKREFYYAFRLQHPGWNPVRYSRPRTQKHVPPPILRRLEQDLTGFSDVLGINKPSDLTNWIDENIASHYRIYFEYLLNLREEYLPGWTRTSLCLHEKVRSLDEVVLPFVALKAVGKATQRADLPQVVYEWKQGEGKAITDGIAELQQVLRSIPNDKVRETKLNDIERLLGSPWPKVALTLVRAQLSGGDGNVLPMEAIGEYRWLWTIRAPKLYEHWADRIAELAVRG
jgi:hypothetical protein